MEHKKQELIYNLGVIHILNILFSLVPILSLLLFVVVSYVEDDFLIVYFFTIFWIFPTWVLSVSLLIFIWLYGRLKGIKEFSNRLKLALLLNAIVPSIYLIYIIAVFIFEFLA